MRAAKRRGLRDLSLGSGALVTVVLTIVAFVWVNIEHLETAGRDDGEAREEQAWAEAVLDSAGDQQVSIHDLIATHDLRFLAPYQEARARFDRSLAQLIACAADDPRNQRLDVAQVARLARSWTISFAEPQIAAVRAGRRLAPSAHAGEREMAQIQARLGDLSAGETRLLHERAKAQAAAYASSRLALILGAAVALGSAILILGRSALHLIGERRLAEQAAEQLREALERAQVAERAKTRFLANMSHEMRTPLNGVAGMAEALAHTRLDPLQRELVDAIRFSSVTLDRLIGDLLSLSREGASERTARASAPFRLGPAVRAAATPFGAETQAKGLGFSVEIAAEADTGVVGDAPRLGQALACLLSNAVKFTDQGEVRLSVRGLGEDRYAFEVSDTGVGFDEARKALMFETFAQSDDSDSRRHGGAGLGLALADRLAAELGGRLEACSTPGVGSVFRFEIELAKAEDEAADQVIIPTPSCADGVANDDAFRVLIVDDNAMNRKVLELILDQAGAQWVSVTDGRQAVEAASRQAFTAILMDVQMPVMDGLTATREIRRLEREASNPAVPVIIVSANCEPENVAAGQAAGAQRHLGKPVSAQVLIEALNEVLAEPAQAA
jgi:signal transduction histidine kinase/ActR/RegA family two-component response regulator